MLSDFYYPLERMRMSIFVLPKDVISMLNLSEFSGHFFEAPYEISNIIHLRDNRVDEIIFYATGFGWASSPAQIRKKAKTDDNYSIEVAIILPYIKQIPGESQQEYLRKLLVDVRKELRYRVTGLGKSYQAIDSFEYGVTRIHKDIHHFALLMRK